MRLYLSIFAFFSCFYIFCADFYFYSAKSSSVSRFTRSAVNKGSFVSVVPFVNPSPSNYAYYSVPVTVKSGGSYYYIEVYASKIDSSINSSIPNAVSMRIPSSGYNLIFRPSYLPSWGSSSSIVAYSGSQNFELVVSPNYWGVCYLYEVTTSSSGESYLGDSSGSGLSTPLLVSSVVDGSVSYTVYLGENNPTGSPNLPPYSGGTTDPDNPGTGGGGTTDPDNPGTGGGGTTDPDNPGTGGGGTTDPDNPGTGGGGTTDPDNPGTGGGGTTDPDNPGTGGGGTTDPDNPGTGGGGGTDPDNPDDPEDPDDDEETPKLYPPSVPGEPSLKINPEYQKVNSHFNSLQINTQSGGSFNYPSFNIPLPSGSTASVNLGNIHSSVSGPFNNIKGFVRALCYALVTVIFFFRVFRLFRKNS